MALVTQVTLTIDQHALQTIKMGLAAMQLSASAVEANINAQVQAQLAAAEEEAPANGAHLNGHFPSTSRGPQ